MKDAAQDDRGWLVSGTAAALASSVMLALCGWIENRNAFLAIFYLMVFKPY